MRRKKYEEKKFVKANYTLILKKIIVRDANQSLQHQKRECQLEFTMLEKQKRECQLKFTTKEKRNANYSKNTQILIKQDMKKKKKKVGSELLLRELKILCFLQFPESKGVMLKIPKFGEFLKSRKIIQKCLRSCNCIRQESNPGLQIRSSLSLPVDHPNLIRE